ncbi:MAG: CPBP family intramembrane metalloprotease [Phycisphaerales bacterium]|nr:CPBP family intramembrane metalloprotease [Phycisphaerales bacterium]
MTSRKLITLCVIPAMVLPFLASFVYFIFLADSPIAKVIYSLTKGFTLIWPIIAVVVIQKQRIPLRGVFDRRHWRAVPLGLLTGSLIGGLLCVGYFFTPLGKHVLAHKDEIVDQMQKYNLVAYYIPFAVFLAVIHSLIEEYFWRWFVFGQLSRVVPIAAAYVLGSLAFAAHHYVVLSVYFPAWSTAMFGTGVGLGGLIWCWQYHRQKSLAGAWVSHAIVDAVFLTIGYLLMQSGAAA